MRNAFRRRRVLGISSTILVLVSCGQPESRAPQTVDPPAPDARAAGDGTRPDGAGRADGTATFDAVPQSPAVVADAAASVPPAVTPAPRADGPTAATPDAARADTAVVPSAGDAAPAPAPVASGLPGKIPGVEPEAHSHQPPVMDGNGNLYRLTETTEAEKNLPRMMKSSNGGRTWAEMDTGKRPPVSDLEGTWQLQLEQTIYVSISKGHEIWWLAFNTSDAAAMKDQWAAAEKVDGWSRESKQKQFSSLVRTSDGKFWIFYSDAVQSDSYQIAYKQRTGAATYGSKAKLEPRSGSWTGPRAVLGHRDVTHVFYKDDGQHQLLWRRLGADGTLSGPTRLDAGGTSKVVVPHVNAVAYDRTDKEIIVVPYAAADGKLMVVTLTDGMPGPQEVVSSAPVLQNPPVVLNDGAVAHAVPDGKTVHLVWSDAASGDIKLRSRTDAGTWSAERTIWQSGAKLAYYVYGSVLTSGGRKRLAFTYDVGPHEDDVGFIEYAEASLD